MSNGSRQLEHRRDVRCEHCGRVYRNDGIHNHQRNCPHSATDGWVVPPSEWDEGDTTSSGGGDDVNPPQDGVVSGDQPTQSVATDGGPQAPPEPDVEPVDENDQDDGDDQDDLPERYVEVDQYVEAVEEEVDHVDTDELRSRLSDFDVVDVEATTADNIVAFERGEVAR